MIVIKYAIIVQCAFKVILSVLTRALRKRCSLIVNAQNGVQRAISVATNSLIKCGLNEPTFMIIRPNIIGSLQAKLQALRDKVQVLVNSQCYLTFKSLIGTATTAIN